MTETRDPVDVLREILTEQARDALLEYVSTAAASDRARRAAARNIGELTESGMSIIKTVAQAADDVKADALIAFVEDIRRLMSDSESSNGIRQFAHHGPDLH
jgi:hypothetical protein